MSPWDWAALVLVLMVAGAVLSSPALPLETRGSVLGAIVGGLLIIGRIRRRNRG